MTDEREKPGVIRSTLLGITIGIFIELISFIFSPHQFLNLPLDLVNGFRVENTDKDTYIFTPGYLFDSQSLSIYFLSLVGLILTLFLVSFTLRRLNTSWRRAIIASVLGLVLSFYIILPIFQYLYRTFPNIHAISDLRYTPDMVFNLHFAILAVFFSQSKPLSRKWFLPVAGYVLGLLLIIIIQQLIPGTSEGPVWRSFLAAILAWIISILFFASRR